MKRFDVITIFPELIGTYAGESILKRAQQKKLIAIAAHDLREFTVDKHRSVDDKPYGGGPGMLMLVDPIARAIAKVKKIRLGKLRAKRRVIMLTPSGTRFTQAEAKRLSKYDQLVLLAGRYEGFDARVDEFVDEKISIGDYVLAGGELPAMIVTEAVARHVPGVLGHAEAMAEETFAKGDDYVEYPQYTRPEAYRGMKVPKVLLSGDHAKVKRWRDERTKKS